MSGVAILTTEPQASIGGKAEGLQRLLRLGLPVPPALIIPADEWPDAAGLEALLREIGPGPYAVRSSALGEDGEARSFAGQHDTVLDVPDLAGVLAAIDHCRTSLGSERAKVYGPASAMAVLVQRMVRADTAGVVFTKNPARPDRDELVIEAVRGLGEALVSGRAAPDRYVVDRASLQATPTGGLLDGASLDALARMALQVEADAGKPQDLEWAIERGQIFLLQARPITTLPATQAGPRYVWSNTNTAELLPNVVTPMAFEILDHYVRGLVGPIFEAVGIDLRGSPIAGRVAGRVYFCLNTLVAVLSALPGMRHKSVADLFGGDAEQMRRAMVSIREEEAPPVRFSWRKALIGVPRLALEMLRFSSGLAAEPLRRAQANTRRRADIELQALDDDALMKHFESVLSDVFTDLRECFFAVMSGMSFIGLTTLLCRRWLRDSDGAIASTLFSGIGGLDSAEAGLEMWRLAVLLRHPDLSAAREAETFEAARVACAGTAAGKGFLSRWEAFLRDHGHHARGEVDVFIPRWREDPDGVFASIRAMARAPAGVDPEEVHRRRTAERLTIERERIQELGPLRRFLLRAVLVRAQRGLAMRENVKSEGVRRLFLTRAALLELGARLVARGRLDAVDDIFFLSPAELRPALAGGEWRKHVAQARRDFVRDGALTPPPLVIGAFDPSQALPPVPNDARRWTGLAVSPGVVEGRARVILSADAHQRLEPGEILVAPFTDPGWAPYFVAAAGLVVDMGGMLSHGSIVAREYGLPAVVNVGHATRAIRTGQRLRVDGHRGEVIVLD